MQSLRQDSLSLEVLEEKPKVTKLEKSSESLSLEEKAPVSLKETEGSSLSLEEKPKKAEEKPKDKEAGYSFWRPCTCFWNRALELWNLFFCLCSFRKCKGRIFLLLCEFQNNHQIVGSV